MVKVLFVSVITFFTLFCLSCTTADLRSGYQIAPADSEEHASAMALYAEALELHGLKQWNQKSGQNIRMINTWHSTTVRLFTPVEDSTAYMQVRMNAKKETNDVRILDETGTTTLKHFGVEKDRSYEVTDGNKQYSQSSSVFLYARPMQNYIQWLFTLSGMPVQRSAGQATIDGQQYTVIYMADSAEVRPLESVNQYLVYIANDSKRITYIQYTVREMLSSYTGSLKYSDFRTVDDSILLPYQIDVGAGLPQETRYHDFTIRSVTFD